MVSTKTLISFFFIKTLLYNWIVIYLCCPKKKKPIVPVRRPNIETTSREKVHSWAQRNLDKNWQKDVKRKILFDAGLNPDVPKYKHYSLEGVRKIVMGQKEVEYGRLRKRRVVTDLCKKEGVVLPQKNGYLALPVEEVKRIILDARKAFGEGPLFLIGCDTLLSSKLISVSFLRGSAAFKLIKSIKGVQKEQLVDLGYILHVLQSYEMEQALMRDVKGKKGGYVKMRQLAISNMQEKVRALEEHFAVHGELPERK